MAKNKKPLLVLFSVVLLDLIGFGLAVPILPYYVKNFVSEGGVELGLLLSIYAAMQFLMAPFWGRLSDSWGRKKTLLLTMPGNIIGLLILANANSLWMLFLGRAISGIFAANISVATAFVSDLTSEENRSQGMGLIGAAFGIRFILGPAFGGILGEQWGLDAPFWAAAGLVAINLFYAWQVLEEPEKHHHERSSLKAALTIPQVKKVMLSNFFYILALVQLETLFPLFMKDHFAFSVKQVGYLMASMALFMAFIQGGLIRRLTKSFGEKKLILMGCILLSLGFVTLSIPNTWLKLLIPLGLATLGRGISQPCFFSFTSFLADKHNRGVVMGGFQSAASLARVFGPSLGGLLYDWNFHSPFYASSLIFLIVLGLASSFIIKKH
ncbi:MAG: MFS transporter [Deltaproteobacteria bacterium]|nr:MFS transporter [Deltaproteobacteria bacterium]